MKESSISDWNTIWKKQQKSWLFVTIGRRFYNFFFLSLLRRYLIPDTYFIELGCGTGSLGFLLAPELGKYVGIDNSQVAIEQAQKRLQESKNGNVMFICSDLLVLNTLERFDVVWSQGLLEHFEDEKPVLIAHLSLLRTGGVALMSVPMKYSIFYWWYIISRGGVLWPWGEQKFYFRSDLDRLIRSVGKICKWEIESNWLLGLHIIKISLPLCSD